MGLKRHAPAPAAPRCRYDSVRERIRTGDILLFRGRGWLSRFIRWGSDSVYSHAGMAAWWGERLVVLQSAGRGVEVLPVSRAVHDYDGQVDWWSLAPEHEDALDRGALVGVAITQLGKPYATVGLVELVGRMVVGRFRGTPDPKGDPESMFCSQYVSYCYRRAGLDLREDTEDACTSPGDLADCGKLALRAVLHRPREGAPDDALHEPAYAARDARSGPRGDDAVLDRDRDSGRQATERISRVSSRETTSPS